MSSVDCEAAKRLAARSREELGDSEEEVKINFVVPLLEALGHSRLRFEHRQKDIVLREGLPRGAAAVVEAKRYGEPLDRHLGQLERYASEERCLLAAITNGDEVRVYAPMWPNAPSFEECLVWELRREDLGDPNAFFKLEGILSEEAMASGRAAAWVGERQAEVEEAWRQTRSFRAEAERERRYLEGKIAEVERKMAELEAERQRLRDELGNVAAGETRAIESLWARCHLRRREPRRPEAQGPERAAGAAAGREGEGGAEEGARKRAAAWTEEDLGNRATEFQRRILAAFVQANSRCLGLKEVAQAARLSVQEAWGALSRFTLSVRAGKKEPLLEIEKTSGKERAARGVLVSISEKYWATIERLYRA
jgi:hypothetical protein